MERLSHGSFALAGGESTPLQAADPNLKVVRCPARTNFSYLFEDLQPDGRLPDKLNDQRMADSLIRLGESMKDLTADDGVTPKFEFHSGIPSAYTYFGQFITHELTFDVTARGRRLGRDTEPKAKEAIPQLVNGRSTLLDLDSLYGPIIQHEGQPCFEVPQDGARMELDFAIGCPADTDLKRQRKDDKFFTAMIGDGRNDTNRITSQMHLAFLRAHNAFVEFLRAGGESDPAKLFKGAQRLLRQHFQWLVINDYLPRVVGNTVRKLALTGKIDIFRSSDASPCMPVEFSAAAFRFGHSMPRSRYNYNETYNKQRLNDFFLPNKTGYYAPITSEWIIDWREFLPGGQNYARRIDTRLVSPLFDRLIDEKGEHLPGADTDRISLPTLDLLRGYELGLPTGQAIAKALGITPMSAAEIESAVPPEQQPILRDTGLSSYTPLWYYVLAEAAALGNGQRLGPVGGTIVAGVLVGLVRCSKDSILRDPNWLPVIGNGHFDLAALFKFAGVLVNHPQ